MEVKAKVTGTPEEIKKLFDAIAGSKEQLNQIASDTSYLHKRFAPFDIREQGRRYRDIAESWNKRSRS